MPELLTKELTDLRDQTRRFAREVLAPLAAGGAPDRATVTRMSRQAGLFGMTQPAKHGGTGAGALALTVVRETLASENLLLPGLFGPGPGVLAGVGEPLASRYLVPLLAGEKRGAFGFTEPSDAKRHTSAVRRGDTLIVNGAKSFVTGGADADFVNTLVDVEGEGRTLLVIDTELPGVTTERVFRSLDGSRHAAFAFHDVAVPAAHLIGEPGEGLPRAMRQIGDTRLAIGAEAVGLMCWVVGFVTDHIEAPRRDGGTLADLESVRLRYADARIETFAARSLLYRTARLAEAGENVVNESIAVKVFATEAVGRVVDGAIQLCGGDALIEGHPLARLYRHVRAMRLAEGASDVLRLNLARGRLDLGKGRL